MAIYSPAPMAGKPAKYESDPSIQDPVISFLQALDRWSDFGIQRKFTYPWSIFPTNDEVKRFRFPIPSTITLSLPDPHLFASPWSMVNSRPPLFSEIALWSTENNIVTSAALCVYCIPVCPSKELKSPPSRRFWVYDDFLFSHEISLSVLEV